MTTPVGSTSSDNDIFGFVSSLAGDEPAATNLGETEAAREFMSGIPFLPFDALEIARSVEIRPERRAAHPHFDLSDSEFLRREATQGAWNFLGSSPNWRVLVGDIARRYGASVQKKPIKPTHIMVVDRPWLKRSDLLVLSPDITTPMAVDLSGMAGALSEGFEARKSIHSDANFARVESALAEMQLESPGKVVFGASPHMEYLNLPGVPASVLQVESGGEYSTAGIIALQKNGALGATAALHGLTDKNNVLIGGCSTSVIIEDILSDSAFLSLDESTIPKCVPTKVMKDILPRNTDVLRFNGLTSKMNNTQIQAMDWGLPAVVPGSQRRVYTPRIAQRGDSGTALISPEGWVIGFAHQRSEPDSHPAFCSWIWAYQVALALDLEIN